MKILFAAILGMYCFFFLEKPIKEKTKLTDCIFVAEKMPFFEGCDLDSLSFYEKTKCSNESLLKFFHKNFRYPSTMGCYSGRIIIRWTIEKDGAISNIQFLRPSLQAIENEVRRIIQMMPCWTPGEQDGKPIGMCFNFPLRLELRD